MKSSIAYGFVTLLGVAASAMAIEPPEAPAPIPPQAAPEEAAAPPVEMPQAGAVIGEQAEEQRAYLGVSTSPVPDLLGEHLRLEPGEGVVVRMLVPAGPAANAGLEQNDVITKVSGKPVGSPEQLREVVSAFKPGEEVDIDFVHRGDTKTARATLGNAPVQPGAIAGAELKPLDQLMLDGMPQDQAKRIHEAIEQNLKAFEGLQGGGDELPEELLGKELHKRMQQMLQGMQMPELPEGGINLKSSGTIRMLDEQGSVELKSHDGGKEVRVFGKDGKIQWEGPYDTPQDREAAPPEVRERIERMNIDTEFKGNGLRLRMVPRR